ncbi:unnamed protein product, partial [Symbiodinium sp. CCMP2456]
EDDATTEPEPAAEPLPGNPARPVSDAKPQPDTTSHPVTDAKPQPDTANHLVTDAKPQPDSAGHLVTEAKPQPDTAGHLVTDAIPNRGGIEPLPAAVQNTLSHLVGLIDRLQLSDTQRALLRPGTADFNILAATLASEEQTAAGPQPTKPSPSDEAAGPQPEPEKPSPSEAAPEKPSPAEAAGPPQTADVQMSAPQAANPNPAPGLTAPEKPACSGGDGKSMDDRLDEIEKQLKRDWQEQNPETNIRPHPDFPNRKDMKLYRRWREYTEAERRLNETSISYEREGEAGAWGDLPEDDSNDAGQANKGTGKGKGKSKRRAKPEDAKAKSTDQLAKAAVTVANANLFEIKSYRPKLEKAGVCFSCNCIFKTHGHKGVVAAVIAVPAL